jgi:hypothetical protein
MPVKFSSINGNVAQWVFEGKQGIELGSISLDSRTIFLDKKEQKKDRSFFESNLEKNKWGLLYSDTCKVLKKVTQLE